MDEFYEGPKTHHDPVVPEDDIAKVMHWTTIGMIMFGALMFFMISFGVYGRF